MAGYAWTIHTKLGILPVLPKNLLLQQLRPVGCPGTPVEACSCWRLHCCWLAAQVLKNSRIVVLDHNAVALEHHASLELTCWVTLRKFSILLNTDAEQVAHVHELSTCGVFCPDFIPLTWAMFIPNVLGTEAVLSLPDRDLSLRLTGDLCLATGRATKALNGSSACYC